MAAASLVFVAGAAVWSLRDIPWQRIADGSLKPVVVLESADGTQLVSQGPYQSGYATLDDFPRHLIDAVISAEDRSFYKHPGVDARGISRALFSNVRAGSIVEGGSTITQQLVKILYLESDRTLKRKVQEAAIALWLERELGKDEILVRYLNNVYLGAGATGMPAAAHVYFGKKLKALTPVESAMLAGLIQAPSQLNPIENPEGARQRTETVLDAMVAAGRLDVATANEAKRGFAEIRPTRPATQSGSWFADWVGNDAREIADPFRGTIDVRTSLMPRLQALAEKVVTETLARQGDAAGASQAALVAMTPDGGVVAMVGGRDYAQSSFNRAVTARRQPGSAFKLFTYYAALKAGISPDDMVEDAPIEIGGWEPENYGGRFAGAVTVREAFARSLNAATVSLARKVGFENVVAAARELGIDAELNPTPSVSLGAYEVSLLDLTGAYASVRAGQAPVEPWGIISFHAQNQPRAFSVKAQRPPETNLAAFQPALIDLLREVVDHGTGQAARLEGAFAAGKTGTSQKFRDAWFIGFSEPLVVGVWVGNDDETPMNEVTGGKLPAQIWHDFMSAALVEMGTAPGTIPPIAKPPVLQAGTTVATDETVSAAAVETTVASIDPVATGAVPLPSGYRAAAPGFSTRSCNIQACSQTYRSFRRSDCSYQPSRGGARKLCTVTQAVAKTQAVTKKRVRSTDRVRPVKRARPVERYRSREARGPETYPVRRGGILIIPRSAVREDGSIAICNYGGRRQLCR